MPLTKLKKQGDSNHITWTRNGPGIDQEWTRKGPGKDQEWTRKGPGMDLDWSLTISQKIAIPKRPMIELNFILSYYIWQVARVRVIIQIKFLFSKLLNFLSGTLPPIFTLGY